MPSLYNPADVGPLSSPSSVPQLSSGGFNFGKAVSNFQSNGGFDSLSNAVSSFSQAGIDKSNAAAALLGAQGDLAESAAYTKAATLAEQNKAITAESTNLQEYTAQRQLGQVIGSQQAAAAANGLTGGGSASDILRSSRQQGALQQQVIGAQGLINENAYEASAASYTGMAKAANFAAQAEQEQAKADKQAAKKHGFGGILSAGLSIAKLFI